MKPCYLDANATTPVLPEVLAAMEPYWRLPGAANASSVHTYGRAARKTLEDAREEIAALIGAYPDEVVFTSGATEANNLAISGLLIRSPGPVVYSDLEHPSVRETVLAWGRRGVPLSKLPVTAAGVVSLDAALPCSTRPALVTLMLANNETGVIQPVEDLARLCAPAGIALHVDAAQAVGRIPVNFHALGATTMSFTAHKFYGPKGIGCLLVRRGTLLEPLLYGGPQERTLRPGTEPVALVIGLREALRLAVQTLETRRQRLTLLQQVFTHALREQVESAVIHAPDSPRVPGVLSIAFPGVRADLLLACLDLEGIYVSAGAACSSGSLEPSPAILAMTNDYDLARATIRISFPLDLSPEDARACGLAVARSVQSLRQSPAPIAVAVSRDPSRATRSIS